MNVRFYLDSDLVLTSEEKQFLQKLISAEKGKQENRKRRNKKRALVSTQVRKSEDSSDYSTSKELQKLFHNPEDSTTSDDGETFQVSEPAYKKLPDVLKDLKEIEYMNYRDSEEEEDESEQCSSQQSVARAERFSKLRDIEQLPQEDNAIASDEICRGYKTVKHSKRTLKYQKKKTKRTISDPDEQEMRQLNVHEQGYFEMRRARGRIRLKELRNRKAPKSDRLPKNAKKKTDQIEFATLNEVLLEKGIFSDTVICCSLCRLLIPNNLREEFFMSPCNCPEKFVHTECALLHQYEMIRQKCLDCKQFNTDRIVCRSRAASSSNFEEFALHQLNMEMTKKRVNQSEGPLFRCRLPAEFEYKCYICSDRRNIRDDKFELLDSTIIKPCRCNVTAHNECVAKSLLSRRTCGYCNYRIRINAIGPKIGYFNRKSGVAFGIVTASVILMGILFIYCTFKYITFPNPNVNTIVQNVCVAIILMVTIYMFAWMLRAWKRKSRELDNNAAVVIRPFRSNKEIDVGKSIRTMRRREDNYEEVPFEDMEKRYPGRKIQKILQTWGLKMGYPKQHE